MALELNGTTGVSLVQNGVLTDANMPAGSVLQVVQSTLTTSVLINSTSYVTTGLSVSITPTSATSKIFVSLSGGVSNLNNIGRVLVMALYKNGSAISNAVWVQSSPYDPTYSNHSFQYLDSPATTSSTTYTIYGKYANGAVYFSDPGTYGGMTTLTAMEIAA